MTCALAEIRAILTRYGISEATAGLICAEITDAIGGLRHYIPARPRSEYADRNAEIMAAFRGDNHTDLAKRHGISARQVRRILTKK